MQHDSTVRRPAVARASSSSHLCGVAFAVFAAVFAVGTLIHECQSAIVWWIAIPVAVAALVVLPRPASPARSKVSSGPVLGAPISRAQEWFGAIRPYVDGGTCQH